MVVEKFKSKILESIDVLDPNIEDKEQFAQELATELVELLRPTVTKNSLNWDNVLQGIVEIINDQELLNTYKNLGKSGVKDIWYYAVIREKKKYKPKGFGRVEECKIVPYGISTIRRIKDTPTCIIYALKIQEDSITPISIYCRGQFRMLAQDVELLSEYITKLESRGYWYEAIDETKFENSKPLNVDPLTFYTNILSKYANVKQISKIIELSDPRNLTQPAQNSTFPDENDIRIVSGVITRKTIREDTERLILAIYDGSVDEPIPIEEQSSPYKSYIVPVDLPILAHPAFNEFEEDDWIVVVGHIFPFGEGAELMLSAINILPKVSYHK